MMDHGLCVSYLLNPTLSLTERRVRIGIGRSRTGHSVPGHVLSVVPEDELGQLQNTAAAMDLNRTKPISSSKPNPNPKPNPNLIVSSKLF